MNIRKEDYCFLDCTLRAHLWFEQIIIESLTGDRALYSSNREMWCSKIVMTRVVLAIENCLKCLAHSGMIL